jgi:hypothetical protein
MIQSRLGFGETMGVLADAVRASTRSSLASEAAGTEVSTKPAGAPRVCGLPRDDMSAACHRPRSGIRIAPRVSAGEVSPAGLEPAKKLIPIHGPAPRIRGDRASGFPECRVHGAARPILGSIMQRPPAPAPGPMRAGRSDDDLSRRQSVLIAARAPVSHTGRGRFWRNSIEPASAAYRSSSMSLPRTPNCLMTPNDPILETSFSTSSHWKNRCIRGCPANARGAWICRWQARISTFQPWQRSMDDIEQSNWRSLCRASNKERPKRWQTRRGKRQDR